VATPYPTGFMFLLNSDSLQRRLALPPLASGKLLSQFSQLAPCLILLHFMKYMSMFLFISYITYDILISLSVLNANQQRKGGEDMGYILDFLVAVEAGVISYYICRWLNRDI
jgi:hypothetical protein